MKNRLKVFWYNVKLHFWCFWQDIRERQTYCQGQAVQNKYSSHCALLVRFLRRYIYYGEDGRGQVAEMWIVHSPRGWQYASVGEHWRLM